MALIILIDQELLTKAYRIKEQVKSLETEFDKKIEEYKKKQEALNVYKQSLTDKIDAFFDQAVKRLNDRREKLKSDYKAIEAKEKRRLKSK